MLQVPDAERRYDLRSVRVCSSAGEPLPKAIYERWLEKFGLEILDGIGSTGMCPPFIANPPGQGRPRPSGARVARLEGEPRGRGGRRVGVGGGGEPRGQG